MPIDIGIWYASIEGLTAVETQLNFKVVVVLSRLDPSQITCLRFPTE